MVRLLHLLHLLLVTASLAVLGPAAPPLPLVIREGEDGGQLLLGTGTTHPGGRVVRQLGTWLGYVCPMVDDGFVSPG